MFKYCCHLSANFVNALSCPPDRNWFKVQVKSDGVVSDTNQGWFLIRSLTLLTTPLAMRKSAKQRSVNNSKPQLSMTILIQLLSLQSNSFQHWRLLSDKMYFLKFSNPETGSPVATAFEPALMDKSHLKEYFVNVNYG